MSPRFAPFGTNDATVCRRGPKITNKVIVHLINNEIPYSKLLCPISLSKEPNIGWKHKMDPGKCHSPLSKSLVGDTGLEPVASSV